MTAREGKDVSETGEPVEGSSARAADTPAARPTDHPAYRCVVLGHAVSHGSASLSTGSLSTGSLSTGSLSADSSNGEPLISHDPHALAAALASATDGAVRDLPNDSSDATSRPARLWLAEACVLPASCADSAAPSASSSTDASSRRSMRDLQAAVDNADTPVSSAKARRRQQREAESHLARVLLGELAAAQGIQLAMADWSPRGQAPHHPALPAGFYVSIAHRHGHVLVGLATAPLGLDLEYHNPRHAHDLDARIAMLPTDARERLAEASHLSETERLDEFYREWVRYEGYLKFITLLKTSQINIRIHL
ncbi:4'-phosphopantetheinyl transferase family protein [Cobetia marina]|uniref:4'-phosphopantetheinyl transferase family protein n=1 Tax=Cobetia marina TaxID=28258 RepID=UPI003850C795